MQFNNHFKKTKGMSLIEVMLYVIIAGIILAMVTRYFQQANDGQRVNNAVSMVQKIHNVTQRYAQSYQYDPGNVGIDFFQTHGALPASYSRSPWRSNIVISVSGNVLNITFSTVPAVLCTQMINRLNATVSNGKDTYVCSGKGKDYSGDEPSGLDPDKIPDKVKRVRVTFRATLYLY